MILFFSVSVDLSGSTHWCIWYLTYASELCVQQSGSNPAYVLESVSRLHPRLFWSRTNGVGHSINIFSKFSPGCSSILWSWELLTRCLNWAFCILVRTFEEYLLFPKFPGDSVIKNSPANAGKAGSILGSGKSPREGISNPLQYSCLGNLMDRGAWRAWGSNRVRHDLATEQQQTPWPGFSSQECQGCPWGLPECQPGGPSVCTFEGQFSPASVREFGFESSSGSSRNLNQEVVSTTHMLTSDSGGFCPPRRK